MSELSLAARAWEDVKAVDDPSFENCTADHRNNLTERADGVVRTGETINLFEEKVKELNALDIKNAPETALGTTESNRVVETSAKAKAEAKAEAKADAKEKADAEADAKAKADEKADEKAKADADAKAKANIQAHKFPIIK